MSLLQGSLSFRRFLTLGPGTIPSVDDICKKLEADRFRPFEDGCEEERFGWADWRNPLIVPPDPNWISQDCYVIFALRTDTRKVPSTLLKSTTELRVQEVMKKQGLAFIGREARIAIQEEVKSELLGKVLPTIHSVDVVWDIKRGIVWTTACSAKAQSNLNSCFIRSFRTQLKPLITLSLAEYLVPKIPIDTLAVLDPIDLAHET